MGLGFSLCLSVGTAPHCGLRLVCALADCSSLIEPSTHEQPKLSAAEPPPAAGASAALPLTALVTLRSLTLSVSVASVSPAAQASRRRSRVEERAALGAAAAMVAGATVGSTGGGGLGPGEWTAEGASATKCRVDTAKPTATTSRPWTRTSPRPGPGSTGSIGLQTADLGRAALGLHPRPLDDPRMLISARFSMHVSRAFDFLLHMHTALCA